MKNALIRHFDIRKSAKSKSRNSGMRACLFLRLCVPRARVRQQVAPRGRGDSAFPLKLLFTDKAVPAASRFLDLARIIGGPSDCVHVTFACSVTQPSVESARIHAACTASLGISARVVSITNLDAIIYTQNFLKIKRQKNFPQKEREAQKRYFTFWGNLGKTFYALFCVITQNYEKRAFLIEKTSKMPVFWWCRWWGSNPHGIATTGF